MAAKVFVTQRPPTVSEGGVVRVKMNLAPAMRFGELIYLAHRGNVERGTEQELLWQFREMMREYNPERDYILPIGHTITMTVAAMVAAERHSIIRFLQWHKILKQYEVYTLDLDCQPLEREKIG